MKTTPFNPETFIGKGWKIESDTPTPKGFNLSKVTLKSYLTPGESYVTGNETLTRIGNDMPLNASVLQYLYEHQEEIPEKWKEKTNGFITYICFDGTVLVRPGGDRCSLYLCWREGQWRWDSYWLGFGRYADDPSAVVASAQKRSSPPLDSLDLAARVKTLEEEVAALAQWAKSVSGFK